jgi:hypothetical protein
LGIRRRSFGLGRGRIAARLHIQKLLRWNTETLLDASSYVGGCSRLTV